MLVAVKELHVDSITQVKLTLMRGLDRKIREQFPSQLAAERALDIIQPRLSDLHRCKHQDFSIGWLLQLADRVGARVTLSVE